MKKEYDLSKLKKRPTSRVLSLQERYDILEGAFNKLLKRCNTLQKSLDDVSKPKKKKAQVKPILPIQNCDNEVHVFVGRNKICSCGTTRLD